MGVGIMLNILITGIAGQLGNRLSELLKDRNIEHRGIGRCPDYKTDVPYLCKDLLEIDNKELKEFIKPVTHIIFEIPNPDAAEINQDQLSFTDRMMIKYGIASRKWHGAMNVNLMLWQWSN